MQAAHGYTYSAHPVACAAGLATLDVLENEDMLARVKDVSPYFESLLHGLQNCPHVTDIRNYGSAGSMERFRTMLQARFNVVLRMWSLPASHRNY
ncbi:MAG: aminotransferase class III-fold pyridoxal phosphate-dependent enzyme [Candidatus Azotimanducaceae bacterium WSBS_2022_MAG_OTU7]